MPTEAQPDPWDVAQANLYTGLTLLGRTTLARKVIDCGHVLQRWTCESCHKSYDRPLSCDLRLCPRCANRRANRFIARHHQALTQMKRPKLLTLTWRSPPELTSDTITEYGKDFAKLRHRKLWRDNVAGGLAGTEFTWADNGWHPHIHALLDADYIPQPTISRAWKRITNGSYIVDIRQCDIQGGVQEVAKYIAKGSTFYTTSHLLHQFLESTKGKRFFTTFGSFYRTATNGDTPDPKDDPPIKLRFRFDHQDRSLKLDYCPYCGDPLYPWPDIITTDRITPPPVQLPF